MSYALFFNLLLVFVVTGSLSAQATTPEQALDDAISLCLQGRQVQALRAFDQLIDAYQPPEGIVALIDYYKKSQCLAPQASQQQAALWQSELAIGRNTNVNQGIDHNAITLGGLAGQPTLALADNQRPKSDTFTQLRLRTGDSSGNDSWQLGLGLRQYDTQNSYDFASIDSAWQTEHALAQWQASTLGGSLYQHAAAVGVFTSIVNTDWRIGVKLQKHNYPNQPAYDDLALESFLQFSQKNTGIYLAITTDNPDVRRPGGQRRGVLAMLSQGFVLGSGKLDTNVYLHQLGEAQDYSPGLIDTQRLQQFAWWQLRYSRPIDAQNNWFIESQLTYSGDQVPLYDYSGNQLLLGWQSRW